MVTKPRSPGNTAISFSISAELLAQIDARAAALGLNRSSYLASLARADLAQGGPLTIRETTTPANSSTDYSKVDAAQAASWIDSSAAALPASSSGPGAVPARPVRYRKDRSKAR